jgi:hypothetical protein
MYCFSPEDMEPISQRTFRQVVPTAGDTVLAVVVLYNRAFESVPCAQRLMQWLSMPDAASGRLRLTHCLVYDNSPIAQPVHALQEDRWMHVFHDAANGGTRAAYLHALQLAQAQGCPWILFLDHDTGLPARFLEDTGNALDAVTPGTSVGAVVPRVFDNDVQISPAHITSYGRVLVSRREAAITRGAGTVTAIASASLVRTESLAAMLPIPASFSLDYLDHWLFRELQRQAAHIAVSSARVQHSLSIQSMKSMGVQRYLSILAAELAFLRGEPGYSRVLHLLWHTGRTVKLALTTRRIALVGACSRATLNIVRAP